MIRRIPCLLMALAAVLIAGSSARAIFLKPDLEKIPVDRLIKNLEDQAEKEKKNITTRYNLARVHAMAYALKVDTCEQVKPKREKKESSDKKFGEKKFGDKKGNDSGSGKAEREGAWFGHTPAFVPFKAMDTDDKAKLEKAMIHLEKAIATYRGIIKDDPSHLGAQIGLAWCIEQTGETGDAIKAYRDVIEKGWDVDRKKKFGPLGGNFITKEAAGYLIPLLNPKRDAEEISTLKARVALLNKLPRPVTPIAVPLRDGLTASDLEDRNAAVSFDADGTGPKRWTWISKDAAWLVHDPKATRRIDSGLQLFGNVTFWCFWENGYEALRSLDDNGDNMLTATELNGLALWHDKNGDGVCDADEVQPLGHYGIVGLSCEWRTDSQHPDRIAFAPRGVLYRDGSTRPTFDLILRQR